MSRPGAPSAGAPQQPPISFKTVPGRNRTQKWTQAKQYNYDGDDWGGYDPYDEYGGQEEQSQAQSGTYSQPGLQRQQSFESGNERRQFSAGAPSYHDGRSSSPAKSTGSSGYSDRGARYREYSNPAQVPPPLNTRPLPSQPPANTSRKNSMGSEHSNLDATSLSSAKADKPLPFIRPSDIYKRMADEKERERQSSESSRPSMDSIQREGTPGSVSGSAQRPLSTVQERPGSGETSTLVQPASSDLHPGYGSLTRPILPPVSHVSDFGPAVLRAAERTDNTSPTRETQRVSPVRTAVVEAPSSGLQGVVQSAFDRQHSTASSVYSTQTAGNVSRSNTDSTSAISPIMSHVPSVTAQHRQHDREPVSSIAEEPAQTHSRNVSGETITGPTHSNYASLDAAAAPPALAAVSDNSYRRSLNASSPAPSGSPARTPAIENTESRRLSGPMTAEIATESAEQVPGRPRRGTDYSAREVDLATEASIQTPQQQTELARAQHDMQNEFLNEHSDSSTSRVATQAPQALQPPPQPSRMASFQPHMPGEWISPAPTPAVEASQPIFQQSTVTPSRLAHTSIVDDNEVPDFSPTTSHKPQHDDTVSSAISAVKGAGSALGAALLSTAGLGHQTKDFGSTTSEPVAQPETRPRNQTGEVTSRLPFHRMVSEAPTESNASVASDVPPTPPAKDATVAPLVKTYFEHPATTTATMKPEQPSPQSARTLSGEYESDKLSKDIMQSLGQTSGNPADTHDETRATGLTLQDASPATRLPAVERPGFLDQRFSWESQQPSYSTPAPVAAPAQVTAEREASVPASEPVSTAAPMAVVGELPHDKDRQSFERPPDGKALHVVNAPKAELVSPIEEESSPTSPVQPLPSVHQALDVPPGETINRNELSPSPVSMGDSSHIPSYYAGVTDASFEAAHTPEIEQHAEVESPPAQAAAPISTPSPVGASSADRQSGRIPPFREILAMKEAPERIKTYTDTRQTFADMNTGLNVWMSGLLAKHPEHSSLVNDRGGFNTSTVQHDGSIGRGHRHNPSILKLNPFSVSDNAPDTPPKDYSDGSRVQMEKMQAKGKDLMKSASAFGGKAQAGAMGLLAKGRNRFGRSDKAKTPPPPTSRRASRTLSSELLTAELARELTGSNHAATFGETRSTTHQEQDEVPVQKQDVVEDSARLNGEDSERKSGFFEKLRRRSRSLTRLPRPLSTAPLADEDTELKKARTNSRSRSRPHSLILLRSNRSDDAHSTRSESKKAYEAEDIPAVPRIDREIAASPAKTRTEGWEHQDTVPRVPESSEDGRLGVLPSPSTFVFSEHAASPQRQRKDSLAARLAEREAFEDEGRPNTSGSVVRHDLPDAVEDESSKKSVAEIEEPVMAVAGPAKSKHHRRSSDLSTLPSHMHTTEAAPLPYWERSGSPVLNPATNRYNFPLQAALVEHKGEHSNSAIQEEVATNRAEVEQQRSVVQEQKLVNKDTQPDVVAGAEVVQDQELVNNDRRPADVSTVQGPVLANENGRSAAVTEPQAVHERGLINKNSRPSAAVDGAEAKAVQVRGLFEERRHPDAVAGAEAAQERGLVGESRQPDTIAEAEAEATQSSTAIKPTRDTVQRVSETTSHSSPQQTIMESEQSSRPSVPQAMQSGDAAGASRAVAALASVPSHEASVPVQQDHAEPAINTAAQEIVQSSAQHSAIRNRRDAEPKFLRSEMISAASNTNSQASSPTLVTQPAVKQHDGVQPQSTTLATASITAATAAPIPLPQSTAESTVSRTANKIDSSSMVSAREQSTIDPADRQSIRSERSVVSSIDEPSNTSQAQHVTALPQVGSSTANKQIGYRPGLSSPLESYSAVFRPLDQLDLQPALQAAQLSPHYDERPYHPPTDERPLSFLPLPRDSFGQPLQESIDRAQAASAAPKHTQSHRASVIVQNGVHPLLRNTTDRDEVTAAVPVRIREESKPRLSASVFPSSSQIDDQYGLDEAQQAAVIDEPHHDTVENKRARRKSGLWDALRKVSSPGPRPIADEVRPMPSDVKRRSVIDMLARPSESSERPKTLKKPRRSASSAAEIQPKRNRLSGFGSLFGRSGTQGQGAPRSNKLAKKAPVAAEPTIIEHPAQGYYRQPAASPNYQEYEAFRRRQSAHEAQQTIHAGVDQQQDSHVQRKLPAQATEARRQSRSAPQDYYGVANGSSATPAFASSRESSQYVLQNEWYWNGQNHTVPEAFKPTEAAYGRVTPVSPASALQTPSTTSVPSRPNWPLRGDSIRHADMPQQTSNGLLQSDEPIRTDPHHGQAHQRQPLSSVSLNSQEGNPTAGRYGPIPPRRSSQYVLQGYQHHETTGQRAYADQQRPWQVSMPSQREERPPIHARTSGTYSALPSLDAQRFQNGVQYGREAPDGQTHYEKPSHGTDNGMQPSAYPGQAPYSPQEWNGSSQPTSMSRKLQAQAAAAYDAQMRGSSYPGQEWMPSIHGTA